MVVFKGHHPTDPKELSQKLRGVNGTFCFYDDLSKWEKAKVEYESFFPRLFFFLF